MMSEMISNKPIDNLMPHYTNTRFNEAQTVWIADGYKIKRGYGDFVDGADYNYSDRIWQWNRSKADQVYKEIDASLHRHSPAYIQEFLRRVFDNPNLVLVHVLAGVNLSNGYPYNVYGYITKGEM